METVVEEVIERRKALPIDHSLLVGISGIDACGKGFVANKISRSLKRHGYRIALIHIDDWLNLPHCRFSKTEPGRHFYHNALRLDEAFDQLITPLQRDRSVKVCARLVEETDDRYQQRRFAFMDIDVVIVEGIFLFKRRFREAFDLKIWVDCSFEKALKRALSRGQEGLGRAATIGAYNRIYFPAGHCHFEVDDPVDLADLIISNEADE